MSVLEDMLSESKEHYLAVKKRLEERISSLPHGSIKQRKIRGRHYYYLQERKGDKVVHHYIGQKEPVQLIRDVQERKALCGELKKVNQALRMLGRAEGRGPKSG